MTGFVPVTRRRSPGRTMTLLVGLVAALLLGGCDLPWQSKDVTPDAGLKNLLLDSPGTGYAPVARATGPLDVATASQATSAATDPTAAALRTNHFRGGYARVWSQKDAYVTDLLFDFPTAADAAAYIQYEVSAIRASNLNAAVGDAPGLPGAYAYNQSSVPRTGGKFVFCTGLWFPVENRAFEIRSCGAAPFQADGALTDTLARQQIVKVLGALPSS